MKPSWQWPWKIKDPIDRWMTYFSLVLIILSVLSWPFPALGTPLLWSLFVYIPLALANSVRGLVQIHRAKKRADASLRELIAAVERAKRERE